MQPSVVHGLESSQSTDSPGWQDLSPQVSPSVQALLSSQATTLASLTHPTSGSHESSVQRLASSQSTGGPEVHPPAAQISPDVQRLPSSQGALLGEDLQPVWKSHESSVHPLSSLQSMGVPGAHQPLAQWSSSVHAFWSSQGVSLKVNSHPIAGSQESSVQTFLSSHVRDPAPIHSPS